MKEKNDFEIFAVCPPGFEDTLCDEARAHGFRAPKAQVGGVRIEGRMQDAWRANLVLRGASRVLIRIGSFRVQHLAQLDKRAHQFPWADFIARETAIKVETTTKKSKVYHQKAASERIEKALIDTLNCHVDNEADVVIKARIVDDLCTLSLDTSGAGLHIRGHKEALNKAPLRETLAALILRACGYDGVEPVLDPMCGSGTFVIEAAEMATKLYPGRTRPFAFEKFVGFDPTLWQSLKDKQAAITPEQRFYGYDRDAGAITRSQQNAARSSVQENCLFENQPISALKAPSGTKGLVVINPPYGQRIGEVKKLTTLYQSLGHVLKSEFSGWRVGLVTNSDKLAQATGLTFKPQPINFSHGGIKVRLYQANVI